MNLAELSKQGKEIRMRCPFCLKKIGSPDTKGHLYVNTETGAYFCHRCHSKGYDKKLKVYKKDLISVVTSDNKPLDEKVKELEKDFEKIYSHEYLLNRGLTERQIMYYGWGTIKTVENFIFLPIVDEFLIGYQGRNTDKNAKMRYYNLPKGIPLKNSLFQIESAKYYNTLYVVEGVFDAISIGLNAVCCFGNYLGKVQREKIKKYNFKNIIFAFDVDSVLKSYNLAKEFKELGYNAGFVRYPYNKKVDFNDIFLKFGRPGVTTLLSKHVEYV